MTAMTHDFEAPQLSPLEWKVVALALREAGDRGCGGYTPPSRVGTFFRSVLRILTGYQGQLPLADPKLETLRRFVCTARGHAEAAADLGRKLVELGFSKGQVAAVAMLAQR
ncbi:hypothetical protein [Flavisphingomonas formosensis]|uniref:hypothetical protein n=1 Tax=Flavisphingomonas formosensis TaxID=861534 RepID=UPI001E5A0B2A|nr:hypothetical protein [Sphingomonas formosensis]